MGAGNSRDPGPARLRLEAKRGARRLLQPIGGEIVLATATTDSLVDTSRYDGTESQKRERSCHELRGPGAARKQGLGGRRRQIAYDRRSVRETAAAAIGVYETTNLTRLGEEQGGWLPRKKGLAVLWPRRGSLGHRFQRRALSNGGSKSGGAGVPVPYEIPPSPEFEAPVRFVGK